MTSKKDSYVKRLLLTGIIMIASLVSLSAPKEVSAQSNPSQDDQNSTQTLGWIPFEDALSRAELTQKPVIVDVWAPWCGWCKKMERDVYPGLSDALSQRFILTRLNRDDNDSQILYRGRSYTPLKLAQALQTDRVPGIIFLSPGGDYLVHITGFVDSKSLREIANQIQAIHM